MDITKCVNENCDKKENCMRYCKIEDIEICESYTEFQVDEEDQCKYQIKIILE